MDPVWARRSSFGGVIAHGMHVVLRALEETLKEETFEIVGKYPTKVGVRFAKPVFPGEELVLEQKVLSGEKINLTVRHRETELCQLKVELTDRGEMESHQLTPPQDQAPIRRDPQRNTLTENANVTGSLDLAVGLARAQDLFPRVVEWLGAANASGIALVSTIVGMEWPGKNSLLSGVKIRFREDVNFAGRIAYNVVSSSSEYALTQVAAEAEGFHADVEAFFLRENVEQPSVVEVQKHVSVGDFIGQVALVVGGARGLGEVTAKLLAAGGAKVLMTYNSSAESARSVQRDIEAAGLCAEVLKVDINDLASLESISEASNEVTHVYYYASPHIFTRRSEPFNLDLFHEFCSFYIDGFVRTVQSAVKSGRSSRFFYPSTVAIDEENDQLVEYAQAKKVGEQVAETMEAIYPGVSVVTRRLPRILTDQTNSVVFSPSEDPIGVLLPILRSMA